MDKILQLLFTTNSQYKDLILLVFRVLICASLIYVHGIPKITDIEAEIANIPDPFGFGKESAAILAIFANIVCPVLIILGLFSRLATLPILAVTLTGLFIVHGSDPAKVRDVPYMYSVAFGLLFMLGPGKLSIDRQMEKRLNLIEEE